MRNNLLLVTAILALTQFGFARQALSLDKDSRPTVVVSHDGDGPFAGHDQEPIVRAIKHLADTGGTVSIGPGEYAIRKPIRPTSNITIKGADGTLLKLPSPVRVKASADKGQRRLSVPDTSEYAAGTLLDVLPPKRKGSTHDEAKNALIVTIAKVEPGTLILAEPLTQAVPEGSRVGYRHNIFDMRGSSAKNVRFESLAIDGGRREGIPMPSHVHRCAILAHGSFSYEKGPTAPPIENLQVVNCQFRNCYGRAVAMYSVVKSKVVDCTMRNIDDEAIDLDHFCYHCEVTGNKVNGAVVGVCLNDASYCTVADNLIQNCSNVGITIWWWHKCPMDGIDIENVIKNNRVLCPNSRGIALGKRCFRNKVFGNYVEGGITVVEPDNEIGPNTESKPDSPK